MQFSFTITVLQSICRENLQSGHARMESSHISAFPRDDVINGTVYATSMQKLDTRKVLHLLVRVSIAIYSTTYRSIICTVSIYKQNRKRLQTLLEPIQSGRRQINRTHSPLDAWWLQNARYCSSRATYNVQLTRPHFHHVHDNRSASAPCTTQQNDSNTQAAVSSKYSI